MCDGRPETQKGVEDRGGAADVEVAEGVKDVDDAHPMAMHAATRS